MYSASIQSTKNDLADLRDDELIRLIYVSHITYRTRQKYKSVFEHILHSSESFNRPNRVTGFLCNNNQYFVQCLEGRKTVVLELMDRISVDYRHKKVKVVVAKPINQKFFQDWRMRSLSIDEDLWTEDSFSDNDMQQFTPFNPNSWPKWFIEYFIDTMQKFDGLSEEEELSLPDFNSIQQFKLGLSTIKIQSKSDMIYFHMYLSLMISALSALKIFY